MPTVSTLRAGDILLTPPSLPSRYGAQVRLSPSHVYPSPAAADRMPKVRSRMAEWNWTVDRAAEGCRRII